MATNREACDTGMRGGAITAINLNPSLLALMEALKKPQPQSIQAWDRHDPWLYRLGEIRLSHPYAQGKKRKII